MYTEELAVFTVILLIVVALAGLCVAWRVRMGFWTKKDTIETVTSIVSSVIGSLLVLKLQGII